MPSSLGLGDSIGDKFLTKFLCIFFSPAIKTDFEAQRVQN